MVVVEWWCAGAVVGATRRLWASAGIVALHNHGPNVREIELHGENE